MIKKYLPQPLKLKGRRLLRYLKDLFSARHFKMVSRKQIQTDLKNYSYQIQVIQPIHKAPYDENKIHNILLALKNLEHIKIPSKGIFSFWHLVGQPSPQKGYKTGRNLLKNQLTLDYGGGLCQLSSLIYHLALLSGMKILERHNHSQDIYTDNNRYTPLGTDSTVVYGYKDIQFINPLSHDIVFQGRIQDRKLYGSILSPVKIQEHLIQVETKEFPSYKFVTVLRMNSQNQAEIMSRSIYHHYQKEQDNHEN